ncbi:MAG: hypothetical protein AAGU11_07760 [Syntrophobacteraceae bacterium]
MTAKIQVETIPVTDEHLPIRRIFQPRGELVLIEDGRQFRHLAYISIKPGPGFFRGGHFHLKKLEYLYIINGSLRLSYVDMDSEEASVLRVEGGNRVTIHPRCAHRFDAISETRVIEYFDSIHDPQDDYRFAALQDPK